MYANIYESRQNNEKLLYEVFSEDYENVIKEVDKLIIDYTNKINITYGWKAYGHYYGQTFREDENMVVVDYGSHIKFIHVKFKEVPKQFGSINEMYNYYYKTNKVVE